MSNYYFVYILASKKRGVLYIGVTNNLKRRISEHKHNIIKGFTSKYYVNNLVYFESHQAVKYAISREKKLKKWNRAWKIRLIERNNPEWKDLYDEL